MASPTSTTPTSAAIDAPWRASFVDAVPALAELFGELHRADDPPVHVNRQSDVEPERLPAILDGAPIAIVDHTSVPTEVAARCPGLKHIVFLGTGPRSYMHFDVPDPRHTGSASSRALLAIAICL